MNYTITCPGCGSRLKLFDSQIKQKQGFIRCTRCGQKIKYDLTKPDPVSTGFWADTEVPFKVGAQKRFLSIAKARQKHADEASPFTPAMAMPKSPELASSVSRIPQAFDRSQNHFQKFDLKTGQIIGEKPAPVQTAPKAAPVSPKTQAVMAAPKPAAPKAQPKPMTPAMRKLAELKKSLDAYSVRPAAPDGQAAPRTVPVSQARHAAAKSSRSAANIPISSRKAARTGGRAQSILPAERLLHTQQRPLRIQANTGLLNRLRSLFSAFFHPKG